MTRARLLLLPLVCLLASGCLVSSETIGMKADGKGTFAATYRVDTAKLQQIIDLATMMFPQQEGGFDPAGPKPDPLHPDWFRAAAAQSKGFTLEKAEASATAKERTTRIAATFETLEAAAKGGAFFNAAVQLKRVEYKPEPVAPKDDAPKDDAPKDDAPEDGAGGEGEEGDAPKGDEKADDTPGVKAWQLVIAPLMEGSIQGMPVPTLAQNFSAALDTLSLERTVTVPSRVLATNVTLLDDGRTVTQKVVYQDIVDAKPLALVVVFEDVEGLALEPFTYQPDLRAMIPRFTKPPPKQAPEKPTTPTTPDAPKTPETPKAPEKDAPEGDGMGG